MKRTRKRDPKVTDFNAGSLMVASNLTDEFTLTDIPDVLYVCRVVWEMYVVGRYMASPFDSCPDVTPRRTLAMADKFCQHGRGRRPLTVCRFCNFSRFCR